MTRDRPPQAPAAASLPAGSWGASSRDPRGRGVRGATARARRKGGGRGWRGPWGCSPTSQLHGRRPPGARGRSHPGTRRHSAASAATVAARGTNTKLPAAAAAAATPLWSDGSYLGPSWVRLRSASLQPKPAQLTCPEDEDGRYALCVSRSFHPGRGSRASGKGEPESTLGAGALGGLACETPRVGALRGGSGAPCW